MNGIADNGISVPENGLSPEGIGLSEGERRKNQDATDERTKMCVTQGISPAGSKNLFGNKIYGEFLVNSRPQRKINKNAKTVQVCTVFNFCTVVIYGYPGKGKEAKI
jgi:hypothetical protein